MKIILNPSVHLSLSPPQQYNGISILNLIRWTSIDQLTVGSFVKTSRRAVQLEKNQEDKIYLNLFILSLDGIGWSITRPTDYMSARPSATANQLNSSILYEIMNSASYVYFNFSKTNFNTLHYFDSKCYQDKPNSVFNVNGVRRYFFHCCGIKYYNRKSPNGMP